MDPISHKRVRKLATLTANLAKYLRMYVNSAMYLTSLKPHKAPVLSCLPIQ